MEEALGHPVDLKALFKDVQAELASRLGTARRNVFHPGAKGELTALDWTALLDAYLPRRYATTKGFVVDHKGNCSDEIDILIHDRQYTPLFFLHRGTSYLPAEAVYCALEVKQDFSKAYVEYAGAKVESVRKLERTTAAIHYAAGKYPAKDPPPILGGVLTSDPDWNPPMGQPLLDALKSLNKDQRLDLGCIVNGGSFAVSWESGGPVVEKADKDAALVFFLLRLFHALQGLGTVAAIDYSKYAKALL